MGLLPLPTSIRSRITGLVPDWARQTEGKNLCFLLITKPSAYHASCLARRAVKKIAPSEATVLEGA